MREKSPSWPAGVVVGTGDWPGGDGDWPGGDGDLAWSVRVRCKRSKGPCWVEDHAVRIVMLRR